MASNNMASNVVIWDQDTCQIPSGVEASSVSMAIQKVLRNSGFHGKIEIITSFHRSKSSADTLKAIEKSGITYEESKFVDKDAANMVLKLALYKWTKQNRIPANVFMISGDGGFLEEVNTLKHLGYQVHWSYRPDSVNDAISHSIDPKLSWYSLVHWSYGPDSVKDAISQSIIDPKLYSLVRGRGLLVLHLGVARIE